MRGLKKAVILLFGFLLALIVFVNIIPDKGGADKATGINEDDVETYIREAIDEMGDNTNLKVTSTSKEDGKYFIGLSENNDTMIMIEGNSITAASTHMATQLDMKQAFELAIGAVNPDMSMGERNQILNKLPLEEEKTDVISADDVMYTYRGTPDDYMLEVKD